VLDGEDGNQPRVIITDKLASYVPAIKRVLPTAEHRRHKRLNKAQRFLETFSAVCTHFQPRRHRMPAGSYRRIMHARFEQWLSAVYAFSLD
jgi:putative transposase